MIRVYVWNYRGLTVAMGHASMDIGTVHISWWPEGSGRVPKIPGSGDLLPLYSVAHIHGQTLRQDIDYEGQPPDHTILLDGLDEARILAWWKSFNTVGREWSTLGQNCSTTVGHALMVGGGDDYALGTSGWWDSWNMVWQPNDVLNYALAIRDGLRKAGKRKDAINFIRKYCSSPLGFTAITANMDEVQLAKDLHAQHGTNSDMLLGVFQELDENRNSDADDVAEVYVNLLRSGKGAPLAVVKSSVPLRMRLIKILHEGYTTSSEQECIDFLKSLA